MIITGLIIFVDVIKDLPTTLMLQPFNFSFSPTQTHGYTKEEFLKQLSLWCLTIVFVDLFSDFFLNRILRRITTQIYQKNFHD